MRTVDVATARLTGQLDVQADGARPDGAEPAALAAAGGVGALRAAVAFEGFGW